jgi:Zn finger protein HypA/HybF involved in hydrogenase expression
MMQVIIPAAIAIVVALLSFYYFINRKEKCTACGSPDSYNELEHKCNKCGNIFWVKREALITN